MSKRHKIYFNQNNVTVPSLVLEVSLPSLQIFLESLGNILDRLDMSEQPSTSRTVPSDAIVAEPLATTPTMFTGIPSVPTSYQQQAGV